MRFGPVPLDEAVGAVLGHTVHADGHTLKKGTHLGEPEIAALRGLGLATVVVARLDPDDVPEDEAAAEVGRAALGDGVRAAEPATGRCNLYATERGVLVVDAARVDAVNAVDEDVTIATLAPWAVVAAGEMVATVKVIPFATRRDVVAACAGHAAGLLRVAPLRPHRAGLVLTRLPGGDEHLLDKASKVLGARLQALGSTLAREVRCAHDPAEVAAAIAALREAACAPILLLGASAVVDRDDVVPTAVVRAGGEVIHLGMPVDPGNLLMLGNLGDTAVIGAPGCARSPAPSGFDRVLERLLAGLKVSGRDIAGMGAGGLLKEIPTRPSPRTTRATPRIAALVLAAGRSSRMGANKLVLPLGGVPIVARVVEAMRVARVTEVIVVTGHDADAVRHALDGTGVRIVHNPGYAGGMSTSLRAGLDALGPVDGVVVALGDMPRVRADHVDALVAAFDPLEGRGIVVPVFEGKRGNPVLWAARYLPEMKALAGDEGARTLILAHADAVWQVPVDDPGVLLDVDTPEALARLGG